jgi:hypothetical protein
VLVTVTRWQDDGARESTDLIFASERERLHVFLRHADDPARFAAQAFDDDEVRGLIERLIAQRT